MIESRAKPMAIDLFCGLGGWTEGLLAEGYDVIGFDIERRRYGDAKFPAQLVVQDVRTLHGSQFRDAALIVASPPCQAYSYRAMPWSRAKALPPPDNTLFETCFRIQREACEAAGRHIPLIVENVRGAQKWVGRSRWNYGSFHLWGDVPALMPMAKAFKSQGMNWSDRTKHGQDFTRVAGQQAGTKGIPHCPVAHWTNPGKNGTKQHMRVEDEGIKARSPGYYRAPGSGQDWFDGGSAAYASKSKTRKAASAMIAKIPFELARYIARVYTVPPACSEFIGREFMNSGRG